MRFKGRHVLFSGIIILFSIFAFNTLILFPAQEKPESQQIYDYYLILDEIDGRHLMYVPLIVNVGDEVRTDENKRYKVIKIEENRATARFVEDVNLEKYKKQR